LGYRIKRPNGEVVPAYHLLTIKDFEKAKKIADEVPGSKVVDNKGEHYISIGNKTT